MTLGLTLLTRKDKCRRSRKVGAQVILRYDRLRHIPGANAHHRKGIVSDTRERGSQLTASNQRRNNVHSGRDDVSSLFYRGAAAHFDI